MRSSPNDWEPHASDPAQEDVHGPQVNPGLGEDSGAGVVRQEDVSQGASFPPGMQGAAFASVEPFLLLFSALLA